MYPTYGVSIGGDQPRKLTKEQLAQLEQNKKDIITRYPNMGMIKDPKYLNYIATIMALDGKSVDEAYKIYQNTRNTKLKEKADMKKQSQISKAQPQRPGTPGSQEMPFLTSQLEAAAKQAAARRASQGQGQMGGSVDYHHKYLKYKSKYLALKGRYLDSI